MANFHAIEVNGPGLGYPGIRDNQLHLCILCLVTYAAPPALLHLASGESELPHSLQINGTDSRFQESLKKHRVSHPGRTSRLHHTRAH